MKWAFLAAGFALIPPLAAWLRSNPYRSDKIWLIMGLLPFLHGAFRYYVAPVSRAHWPGFVKGIEVSLIDFLVVAIYISLPRRPQHLPFCFAMALYFTSVLLSTLGSYEPTASSFYVWQLARMFIVYAVVARACVSDTMPSALLTGMILGIALQAVSALWGRFVGGEIQAGGTLGHQNALGMLSHFVLMPSFALLLAGARGWKPIAGIVACLVAVLSTASRASLGLALLGVAIVFFASALRGWTSRKAWIALGALLTLAILAPLAAASLSLRFETEQMRHGDDAYDERAALERAAGMILSEHPFGIGPNTYAVVAIGQGYHARAGVAWNSISAHVHNVYRLIAAETGYLGLFGYLLVMLQALWTAARCSRRHLGDMKADFLLGLGVGLLMVCLQSFYEWISISFLFQYMLAMSLGLIAGLARQLGYWKLPLQTTGKPEPSSHSRLRSRGSVYQR